MNIFEKKKFVKTLRVLEFKTFIFYMRVGFLTSDYELVQQI